MSEERIFGTDGVRGRAGEGWLHPDRVSALGRAIGRTLHPGGERAAQGWRALLGHDGRRSGPELLAALGRGLASVGYEVASAGLTTSPGLALLTREGDFELGAMLSASHNPAEDNGIKVFSGSGEKLSDELEQAIEAELHRDPEPVRAGPEPSEDAALEARYVELLRAHAGSGLELGGLRAVLDCANGGASHVGPRLLRELGVEVYAIHASPDGDNINHECGSTSPESLRREVVERRAAVGIALDGDADRCILVDERGGLVNGDGILTVLAHHVMEREPYPDPRVVATVMSNRGLHRALREVGVGVVTVGVGDRRVVEALRQEGLALGGEQSGHVIFGADNDYIGDGLYTALRVLRVLSESGRSLSELAAPYRAFPQVLVNVSVARMPAWSGLPAVEQLVRRIEEELGEDGRVLLRYSGTEPLARVMVEGPDADRIRRQADELAAEIQAAIGA